MAGSSVESELAFPKLAAEIQEFEASRDCIRDQVRERDWFSRSEGPRLPRNTALSHERPAPGTLVSRSECRFTGSTSSICVPNQKK